MMAIGTFPGMLQEGDHASRPAATAVGSGALYACSTHGLIYQSDGSSWSTWATLGGGAVAAEDVSITDSGAYFTGTDVEAALQELGAAGGGGGGWTLGIDESGASFANFTADGGTWASAGGLIQQTATGASARRARHATKIPQGAVVIGQAEIRLVSGAGADAAAGLLFGHQSGAGSALAVVLEPNSDTVQIESQGVAAMRTHALAMSLGTWYTLRVVVGRYISVYVDGTLLGSTNPTTTMSVTADLVGLYTYDVTADFRNIKFWTLALPA